MDTLSSRRTLAENLRILRIARHLSQEGLAERVGLDRSYVSALERAEVNIGLDNLEKIAEALGITLIELLTERDPHQVREELVRAVRRSGRAEEGEGE